MLRKMIFAVVVAGGMLACVGCGGDGTAPRATRAEPKTPAPGPADPNAVDPSKTAPPPGEK